MAPAGLPQTAYHFDAVNSDYLNSLSISSELALSTWRKGRNRRNRRAVVSYRCDSSRRCLLLQVSATPAGLVIYLPAYSTSISEATRTGVALKRYAERAIPVDRITSWPVEIGLVCRHHVLMIWSPELLGDLKRNEKVTRQLPGNIGCPPGIHVMIMTDR